MIFNILYFILGALFAIAFLLIVCSGICIAFKLVFGKTISISDYIMFIIGFVLLVSATFLSYQSYDILDKKIKNGYEVYLDGNEINPENISFGHYNVSINDEEKNIYLSQKKTEKRKYIPVIIPRKVK